MKLLTFHNNINYFWKFDSSRFKEFWPKFKNSFIYTVHNKIKIKIDINVSIWKIEKNNRVLNLSRIYFQKIVTKQHHSQRCVTCGINFIGFNTMQKLISRRCIMQMWIWYRSNNVFSLVRVAHAQHAIGQGGAINLISFTHLVN